MARVGYPAGPASCCPCPVLTKLFQGLMLAKLLAAHKARPPHILRPACPPSPRARPSRAYLAPLRRIQVARLRKAPVRRTRRRCSLICRAIPIAFAHRQQAGSSRSTRTVSPFRYKDYRVDGSAAAQGSMTLATSEFIRRFLIHVLPKGFHRIRPLRPCSPSSVRADNNRARPASCSACQSLKTTMPMPVDPSEPPTPSHPCPCCGGPHDHHRDFPSAAQHRVIGQSVQSSPSGSTLHDHDRSTTTTE